MIVKPHHDKILGSEQHTRLRGYIVTLVGFDSVNLSDLNSL